LKLDYNYNRIQRINITLLIAALNICVALQSTIGHHNCHYNFHFVLFLIFFFLFSLSNFRDDETAI